EARPDVEPLLARLHPAAAETHALRVDAATDGFLPAQLFPLLTVHLAAACVRPRALCDAAGRAKMLGVTRHQLVQTAWWGLLYGGHAGSGGVAAPLEPILATWPADTPR